MREFASPRDAISSEVLEAAKRIKSERYIGSKFVADARVLAKFVLSREPDTRGEARRPSLSKGERG